MRLKSELTYIYGGDTFELAMGFDEPRSIGAEDLLNAGSG